MKTFDRLVGIAAVLAAAACADAPGTAPGITDPSLAVGGVTQSYLLLGSANALPADLSAQVAALGGSVTATMPAIGVAAVTSDDPAFLSKALKIKGIAQGGDDPTMQWVPNETVVDAGEAEASSVTAAGFGDLETFRAIQWGPDAISAPAAWNAGNLGAGARVAILDGGIHSTHIDIAPNLDVAHSTSFTTGAFNTDVGTFWHGTHVAGIVAAAGNNLGTVGIAPRATIIGVKVLHNGSGPFSAILQGMVYASTPIAAGGAGADIINMSLGAMFYRQAADAAHLANAVSRAATYATQQGTLVIAAAGNSAIDLDHTANLVFFPAQGANVLAVSATAPVGWATGGPFNFDQPTSYTNFGQSAIDFAAPGGDSALPGNALCTKPRNPVGSVTVPCWVFDLVMAPCRGSGASISSYCWAGGTSMASPHVAGVAALIVGRYGHMKPAQLEAILRRSADDLGKPGNDDYYGGGRVNAWRAVQ